MTKNMPYKKLTITLPVESLNLIKKISKIENRPVSNMVCFLIKCYGEVMDCYYCHNREKCPVKNIKKKSNNNP